MRWLEIKGCSILDCRFNIVEFLLRHLLGLVWPSVPIYTMLAESWFESESRLCASCRMFPVLCACAQARRRSTSRRRWSTFATSACRWWRRSSSLSWRWRRWPRKSTASSRLSRHLRRRHEGPAQYSRSYVYDMEGEPAMCEVSCVTLETCV